jgi:hypothetical protein
MNISYWNAPNGGIRSTCSERAQHKLGSAAESRSVVRVQPAYSHHKIALSYFRIDRDGRTKPGLAYLERT